jgi:aspartate/methionine/tyrosine aminotransferase
MADAYERGISCVTLSKPWGGCGITIGWLASQDLELLERIQDWQYFGTACPSRASELQAIMCLRASDIILERNLTIIRHNKTLLERFMTEYRDLFTWVPPTAGAIAAIRFQGPLTSLQLGDKLADVGIGIKPAYCFNDNVVSANDYFRVGFGESKMPAALDALRRFVEEHKEAWRATMSSS